MKRIILYPYKIGSASAKALQVRLRELGHEVLRVRPDGKYRPRATDIVINWGNSKFPNWVCWWDGQGFNSPDFVKIASNKLNTFRVLSEKEVPTVEWSESYDDAYRWALYGHKVVCREKLTGHGGEGISIQDGTFAFEEYPLYTKYIEKDAEYRVHIFKGECIDYAKKIQRNEDVTEEQFMIGSHKNGWYFLRDIKRIEDNIKLAKQAVSALGLDFGAVDIIRKDKISYVLEVNSAPGLEGISLDAYVNSINNLCR